MEAGTANRAKSGAEGGYRHAQDIVKLPCLGANRVGFGTLAMVSLGCTICRGCQLDTCHVGIATQIESEAEAQLKGLKKFTPQVYEAAVESCARFFRAMGEEVEQLTAALGFARAQDLVGRSDLLVQSRAAERVDVNELIRPLEQMLDLEPLDLPTPADEREAAGLVAARPLRMASSDRERVLGTAGAGALARGRGEPLDDSLGCLADRANVKGFAFEYMTAGRAVVLGDPGPWFCAGQTGGRVYLRVNAEWKLDRPALERRRGKGAKVAIADLDAVGVSDIQELLGWYREELWATGQDDEAERI